MCRFLADLLNPDGAHRYGILFLKSFLCDVLNGCSMSDALLAHTSVVTEYRLENRRRIDIVIKNAQYFIPIETKINFDDSDGQCYDYYQYARNAPIVYLTKFGSPPPMRSRMQRDGTDVLPLENIRCLSWARDIAPWLTSLLPELDGLIKALVTQYIEAIHIVEERRRGHMEQSIQAVLASPEFFSAGLELERSMKAAKVALIRLVFDCFKEEMEPVAAIYGLELETDTQYFSYEHSNHDKFYDEEDGTCPGLNYVVKWAKFQANSLQMWFRIEVNTHLVAGFSMFDTEAEPQYAYPKGNELDEISPELIKEASQYLDREIITPNGWWLAYCHPNGSWHNSHDVPDFMIMNPCAVSLVDPQTRLSYVRKAIDIFENQLLSYLDSPRKPC